MDFIEARENESNVNAQEISKRIKDKSKPLKRNRTIIAHGKLFKF